MHLDVLGDGLLNQVEQRLRIEGFFDEVHRASLQRSHGGGYVAVAGQHDHGDAHVVVDEPFLQLQAAHAGHADIGDQAAAALRRIGVEKLLGARERLHRQAGGVDQQREAVAHRPVVVDDEHRTRCVQDAARPCMGMAT